jgi:hypothetical protein
MNYSAIVESIIGSDNKEIVIVPESHRRDFGEQKRAHYPESHHF